MESQRTGSGLAQSAKAFRAWGIKMPSWDAQAKKGRLSPPLIAFSLHRTIR
jgi:hypothetical protein